MKINVISFLINIYFQIRFLFWRYLILNLDTFLKLLTFSECKIPVLPTAVIVYMENIGFVYPAMSMMVIGPSLPILRQNRWSLLYDVY
jgi:hypothetical protein